MIALAILVCLLGLLWLIKKSRRKHLHCFRCDFDGCVAAQYTGSIFLELLAYLFGFLPGIVYSMMRDRFYDCPSCGHRLYTR